MDNRLKVGLQGPIGVEEAFAHVTRWLRQHYKISDAATAEAEFQFSVRGVVKQLITDQNREAIDAHLSTERPFVDHDLTHGIESFNVVFWELVRRGVAVPALSFRPDTQPQLEPDHFRLTPYGHDWVRGLPQFDVLPSDFSRFGAQLSAHDARFGPLYTARAQEALRCYRAHLYLASCTMAGAAAEAIALVLATAKTGDAEQVRTEYGGNKGTKKLKDRLVYGLNGYLQREIESFLSLLSYWRAQAAHAAVEDYDEPIAFTAMLLLLRFAHTADTRWADIVGNGSDTKGSQ